MSYRPLQKTIKNLILSLAILCLLPGLSACGGQKQPAPAITAAASASPDTTPATSTPVPTVAPVPVSATQGEDENAVITFASYEFDRAFFEPLMEAFHQANPTITVQFVPLVFPSSDPSASAQEVEQAYLRNLASSADVTLIFGRSSMLASYFRDLQPQIDSDPAFSPDDFWPDALTACQDAQGRTLGIPVNLLYSGIFYDEQAFTAAGIAAPQPGWTWDEFRQDAAALSQGDGVHFGYGDPTYTSVTSALIAASLETTDGELDEQALSQSLAWYVDLAKTKAIYPIQGIADGNTTQEADQRWKALFQENHPPAMWLGRLQDPIPGLAGVSEDTDPATHLAVTRFGIAPFPVDAGNANAKTTPFSAQCAAVSAGSAHPRAAWAWINFLSQHWLIRDRQQASELTQIPARQSVAEKEGFWQQLPASAQPAVRYGLQHALFSGLYTTALDAVLGALENAASGKMALADALDAAKVTLSTQPQPAPETAPIVVATPQAPIDPASDAAVIRYYFGNGTAAENEAVKALVERFNREHAGEMVVNLATTYDPSSGAGYYQPLADQFDCFSTQIDPGGAASSGVILKLDALFDQEDQAFKQDFDSFLLDASRTQGDLYDLPFTSQPPVMAYNADLLAKLGVQAPSGDWTFEDFIRLATAATSQEKKVSGFLPASQSVDTIGLLYAGRKVQWLNSTDSIPTANFDTPQMADMLVWLSQLYQSGVFFQPAAGEDWWRSMVDAVQSDRIAFWTTVAGQQETDYFDFEKPPFKVGIVPLPVVPAINNPFARNFDRGFYISTQSKNPQACWTWIKFLSEQPSGFNGVPARTSVANSPVWETSVGKENAAIYRQAVSQIQASDDDKRGRILRLPLETWKGQTESDVQKGMDAQQTLTEAQRKADAYQACMSGIDFAKLSDQDLSGGVMTCAKQADPSWQ